MFDVMFSSGFICDGIGIAAENRLEDIKFTLQLSAIFTRCFISLHIYSSIRKYRNIPDKLIIEIIHVGVESSVSNTNVDRIAQKARPK